MHSGGCHFIDSLQDYVKSEVSKLADELDKAIKGDNTDEAKKATESLVDYFSVYPKVFESEEIKKKIKFKIERKDEFKPAVELLLPHSEIHRLKEILRRIDSYVQKGCKPISKYIEVKKLLSFPDLIFYKELDESTLLDFIKALGGDRVLEDVNVKRKVIDSIGLQCVAVREWHKHMHEVKEVDGRSYDLGIKEKELCIEVKSTSHSLDVCEVELRRGQIDALINDVNTNLYIITEVLSRPKLSIADKGLVSSSFEGASIKVKARELVNPSTQLEESFNERKLNFSS